MAIYTTRRTSPGAKASFISRKSRAPYLGYAYEGLKHTSRAYGFYKDIKPYLPETYLDKYRYKPHKRVAGYLGQYAYGKKIRRIPQGSKTSYQFNQESTKRVYCRSCRDQHLCANRKSRQYTGKYSSY